MQRPQPGNRLHAARLAAAAGRLDESLAIYAELVGRDAANAALFAEMMTVRAQWVALRAATETVQQTRDAGILAGRRALAALRADPALADPKRLERHGATVYSQHDEDGILAEIFRRIGTANRCFFEFGVEDGLECNTHLLLHQGWQGGWAEAGAAHAEAIRRRFRPLLDTGRLRLAETIVTRENIDEIARALRLPEEIDLLSIDIDGNDYWVFKALTAVRPRVVAIEYNAKFPPPMRHVIAYRPDHAWQGTDYYGASLQSLADLAATKGYRLVGCNITGVNAFFVRADLCGDRFAEPATAAALYQPPRYELFRMGAFETGHAADFGAWLEV